MTGTGIAWIPLLFVILITLITIGLGIYTTRMARTASDFFVAGRSVNVFWNASAISGEYLSAASFMGIAGMLMKNGYDALWYPVGYATGYLFLLLFIAGPLRRFGAYTIPDFAEGRFDSPLFRRIAVTFVLFIGFFYTMPQMKGAGVTMAAILNWPYWVGIAVVGSVITFNVALGGMKGITFVQAFQYWAKMFAISAPVFVLMSVYGGYNRNLAKNAENPTATPRLAKEAVGVKFKGAKDAPANAVAFSPAGDTQMLFPEGALLDKVSTARKPKPGESPVPPAQLLSPMLPGLESGANVTVPPGTTLIAHPYSVLTEGRPVVVEGRRVKTGAKIEFKEPTVATLPADSPVPNAPANKKWLEPFGTLTGKWEHPLLYTYSLIIALVCGTAGLPHILVRFYTNPDGRAAKRTTLWVMVLIGTFYLFPPIWGALGRAALPALYINNTTDSVVIKLPMTLNSTLGQVLSGITSAGAFAAFMSTFSGLLVSMSGALAHDIYGKMLRPDASPEERLVAFKIAAVIFGAIAMLLGIWVENFDINMMVGWAFAIAAASYFPLLLLGSWWRGLTKYGAAIGMLTGGLLSLAAIVCSMLLDKKVLIWEVSPLTRSLMEQPAIWGVPLALGVMYLISRLTAHHLSNDVHLKMLRLHAPEEMGISKDYIEH
ncbi:MAG TPA: cation acetate symporter [Chthonomonadaceae bacterium]|nr:cation acetate symporter [Chthonomonadaceae bacterium]